MSRYAYYDVLRVIAMSLVIFNHVPGFLLYQHSHGAIQGVYMVISVVTKINVPIFFMISGALLLGKQNESISRVLKKRVTRFIYVIIIFSGITYLSYCVATSNDLSLSQRLFMEWLQEKRKGQMEPIGFYINMLGSC